MSSRTSGLTTSEQCQILVRLKELIHLRRGDFLCEVLEYLDSHTNYQNIKLNLQEFWPSEDYYFHTENQMKLVKKYCPHIKKVYFMYKSDCCGDLAVLENFGCLTGNIIILNIFY